MHKTGFTTVCGAVLDIGPARLEVGIVRHRGDLQPFLLSCRPDLDIIGHGRAETDVARAQALDPVGQSKTLTDGLGISEHLLEHGIRFFRLAEDVHFDLVELVAALDAAYIRLALIFSLRKQAV